MTRWKITIEYNGRDYHGFQIQPDVDTIQGAIERAMSQFCQQDIGIVVAGRTDAGVHARGQIAHFDLDYKYKNGQPRDIDAFTLIRAINANLMPQPISIVDAQIVDPKFHARFQAKQKHYMYRIINRPYALSLDQGLAWWCKTPLNIQAMEKSAQYLIGEHDFSTFRDSKCQAQSPIRSVDEITLETHDILNGQEIFIHVRGRAFLHHMVRNIAGSLSMVGEGKWQVEDMLTALNAKDRTHGGPTAPSDGLYLQSINYI